MKNKLKYIVPFLPVSFIIIFLISRGFLFGSLTDWVSQHSVFPDHFRNLFYQTKNLFPSFSFNIGGGQNIFNFAYYGLLSPYNLISYLLPFIKMVNYIMIVNILLLIINPILLYKWLKNKTDLKKNLFLVAIFSLTTSVLYHSHVHFMFVNYMPFLIIGLIGIDQYVNKNKPFLLIISIFLMAMTSFYYIISCVFVLYLYYLYLLIKDNCSFKNIALKTAKFITPVLIALLMSSILLFPTFLTIISGRGITTTTINIFKLCIPKFSINSILHSAYGIGMFAITFIAIINNILSKKKETKILSIIVCIVLLFPIFLYILNGTLYVRAKILIPFAPFLILLTKDFLEEFKKDNSIRRHTLIIILMILSVLLFKFEKYFLIITDISLTIAILTFIKFKNKEAIEYICLVLLSTIISLQINLGDNLVSREYHDTYFKDKDVLIDDILKSDLDYYRTINLTGNTYITANKIYNDRHLQTSIYSSVYNNTYNNFITNTINNSFVHRNKLILSNSNNIMLQTLMGVKYIITDNNIPIGYNLYKALNKEQSYVNDNVLPIGYANKSLISNKEFEKLSFGMKYEALINNIVVDDDVVSNYKFNTEQVMLDYEIIRKENLDYAEKESMILIKALKDEAFLDIKLNDNLKDKILFITFDLINDQSCSTGDLLIKINGIANTLTCKEWIYYNNNHTFSYVISSNKELDSLKIYFSKGYYEIDNINIETLDYNKIININDSIDKLEIKEIKGDKLVGSISVKQDAYFIATIPYDNNFKIKVDGKDKNYELVSGSFIGFKLTNGVHDIEISYKSKGLLFGQLISIAGLLSMIIFIRKRKI